MSSYEIIERLGAGGMGEVYRAKHHLLGEERIIKVMRPELRDDTRLRARFAREARLAASFKHQNLASIFDFGFSPSGSAYIVMEYVRGLTLSQASSRQGKALRPGLVAEIGIQALRALRFLHGRGIVHRDVSPVNLLLTVDPEHHLPRVVLIDLGIAKIERDELLTQQGFVPCNKAYASPEQLAGLEVDARTDLFSLAKVLGELLEPVGAADAEAEGSATVVTPDALKNVLRRAMEKEPSRRFRDAGAFKSALERWRGEPDLESLRDDARWIAAGWESRQADTAALATLQAEVDALFTSESLTAAGNRGERRAVRQTHTTEPSTPASTFASLTHWAQEHKVKATTVSAFLAVLVLTGMRIAWSSGQGPPQPAEPAAVTDLALAFEPPGLDSAEPEPAAGSEAPAVEEEVPAVSAPRLPDRPWGLLVDDAHFSTMLLSQIDLDPPRRLDSSSEARALSVAAQGWPVAIVNVASSQLEVGVRGRQLPACEVLVSARVTLFPSQTQSWAETFQDRRPSCGAALASTARVVAAELEQELRPLLR